MTRQEQQQCLHCGHPYVLHSKKEGTPCKAMGCKSIDRSGRCQAFEGQLPAPEPEDAPKR